MKTTLVKVQESESDICKSKNDTCDGESVQKEIVGETPWNRNTISNKSERLSIESAQWLST